jgi:shikimate kinase
MHDLAEGLGERNIVFVGMMGAGKSAIGRVVASWLGRAFVDADREIEQVSRMSIPDLFEAYGESEFRALEERVIKRLLGEKGTVLATGGGAFMNPNIRTAIANCGVSVWLNADIDTLMERVAKRKNRPLLRTADPRAVMARLIAERYPVYATADVEVVTRDVRREIVAQEVLDALRDHLAAAAPVQPAGVSRP